MEGRIGQSNYEQNITPERLSELTELLKTEVWGTMETLHIPASNVEFEYVERDLEEPPAAREYRLNEYIPSQIQKDIDKRKLLNPDAEFETRMDDQREGATNKLALFQKGSERPAWWDGRTITMAQSGVRHQDGKLIVPVYPIDYSEWTACEDEKYLQAFKDAGLPLPYAGVGISVLLETTDETYPLTQRGGETPVYPGRLYTVGGGPKAGQTQVEAIMEEIVEESGLEDGEHFDKSNMTALAVVTDEKYVYDPDKPIKLYAKRPELVLTMPVNVSFAQLERIRHEKVNKGGKEADVWGMFAVSSYEPSTANYIVSRGGEMCPPLEAGLAHALMYKFSNKQGMESTLRRGKVLIDTINSSVRPPFVPTIVK